MLSPPHPFIQPRHKLLFWVFRLHASSTSLSILLTLKSFCLPYLTQSHNSVTSLRFRVAKKNIQVIKLISNANVIAYQDVGREHIYIFCLLKMEGRSCLLSTQRIFPNLILYKFGFQFASNRNQKWLKEEKHEVIVKSPYRTKTKPEE